MKNVCFTGHRELTITAELKQGLIDTLATLIENGAVHFYAGGADGFDLLCEIAVLRLHEKYPNTKLHIKMPCPENEQIRDWKLETDKNKYHKVLSMADSIEICSVHRSGSDCMRKRNKLLVELADVCICYYNSNNWRSGTGMTVRMAEKKGIDVINLFFEKSYTDFNRK